MRQPYGLVANKTLRNEKNLKQISTSICFLRDESPQNQFPQNSFYILLFGMQESSDSFFSMTSATMFAATCDFKHNINLMELDNALSSSASLTSFRELILHLRTYACTKTQH